MRVFDAAKLYSNLLAVHSVVPSPKLLLHKKISKKYLHLMGA
jgi:hypothetical protein